MDPYTLKWTKQIKEEYIGQVNRVLDVGSLNVNGSPRELFNDAKEYVGLDMREGKDVDIVMNSHDMKDYFEKESFDLVCCYNTLEHDNKFWVTLENIHWVLKVRGWLIIGAPTFNFPKHDYPYDYWRFGMNAYKKILFNGYRIMNLITLNTKPNEGGGINPVINCLGRKF